MWHCWLCCIVQVMRVVVFDRYGTVLHKFGCSRHLEFPNGVVANDQDEIFISDNRSHCVKVQSVIDQLSLAILWLVTVKRTLSDTLVDDQSHVMLRQQCMPS